MTRVNTQSRFIARFINQSYDKKRLGDVSSVFSGKTIDLALENEGGPVAYLKVADLNLVENDRVVTMSSRFVSEQTAKTSGLVPIGATIFPKNGAAALHNKKRITSIITCIDMNTMAVYSTSENVKPEYLYSFLESQDLAALTLVGAIPQIRAKDVQALLIPMPTVEEQERYIAMMHQADKSKFNDFKSRFFEQFSNPKIARVPLIDLCSLFIDGDWIEAKDQSNSGYRLVQTGNVGVCEYLDKEEHSRFVSEETFKRLNCTEIHSGDILFSRLPEPIGRCCIIPKGFPKAITAVDCTITRLKDNCLPEYLMVYTTTAMYSEQIKKCITGTTRQRISRGNLAKIVVPLPDLQQQKEFVLLVHQADKSKYFS